MFFCLFLILSKKHAFLSVLNIKKHFLIVFIAEGKAKLLEDQLELKVVELRDSSEEVELIYLIFPCRW